MPILTVCNQKGGCSKTVSVTSIAHCLTLLGNKVLVLDFDPQCSASMILAHEITNKEGYLSLYDVFTKKCFLKDAIYKSSSCDIVPGSNLLYNWKIPETITKEEYEAHRQDSEWLLQTLHYRFSKAGKQALVDETVDYFINQLNELLMTYDFILLDTNPNLNDLLLVSIYAAAKAKSGYLIVPAFLDEFSRKSIVELHQTLAAINLGLVKKIKIAGILSTQVNARTLLAKKYTKYLKHTAKSMGTILFETKIRSSASAREFAEAHMSLIEYDEKSTTSQDYKEFTKELIGRIAELEALNG